MPFSRCTFSLIALVFLRKQLCYFVLGASPLPSVFWMASSLLCDVWVACMVKSARLLIAYFKSALGQV